ncbi:signal peptidase I [Deinococcus radiophilus]|uniref:signal peptidase I n=1 Tax=Deinococcus radiophilus TaxID=32062 RepID=UPI00361F5C01
MPATVSPPRLHQFWAVGWPYLLTALLGLVLAYGVSLARVSGDSMRPTLQSGNLLLLQKYPRWLDPDFPQRGDLVVFRGPPGSPYSYADHQWLGLEWRTRPAHIKRVLATAGDRVEARKGGVVVNGQAWPKATRCPAMWTILGR